MEIREPVYRIDEILIFVSFPDAVIKYSNKRNLREKGAILGYLLFNSFFLAAVWISLSWNRRSLFRSHPYLDFTLWQLDTLKAWICERAMMLWICLRDGYSGNRPANLLSMALPLRAAVCLLSGKLVYLMPPSYCKHSYLPSSVCTALFL